MISCLPFVRGIADIAMSIVGQTVSHGERRATEYTDGAQASLPPITHVMLLGLFSALRGKAVRVFASRRADLIRDRRLPLTSEGNGATLTLIS